MIEEQNNPSGGQETSGASQRQATSETDAAGTPKAEYDAVDHPKKDVLSTIGDGEMHDEGMAGLSGDATDINATTDDQEGAEQFDRES